MKVGSNRGNYNTNYMS